MPLEGWRVLDSGLVRILREAARAILKPWGIETLFGASNVRGFNIEDSKLQDSERLSRLLTLQALAFTWAFVVGLCEASVKELKLKKGGYPPKSIFRSGLNILRRLVTNFERFDLVVWRKVIKFLSCN
jgi:hypothetical protein